MTNNDPETWGDSISNPEQPGQMDSAPFPFPGPASITDENGNPV
jgi:hypothetical protein